VIPRPRVDDDVRVTAEDVERALADLLAQPCAADSIGDTLDVDPDTIAVAPDVITFEGFGMLTHDRGLVLMFPSGEHFALTIQQRR
jgi:hypothetical protein